MSIGNFDAVKEVTFKHIQNNKRMYVKGDNDGRILQFGLNGFYMRGSIAITTTPSIRDVYRHHVIGILSHEGLLEVKGTYRTVHLGNNEYRLGEFSEMVFVNFIEDDISF